MENRSEYNDKYMETVFLNSEQFVQKNCFQIPENPFVYNPCFSNLFSTQGEEMVWTLLRVMPFLCLQVEKLLPPEEVSKIVQANFDLKRSEFFEKNPNFEVKKKENKLGTPFYATKRQYDFLVPFMYKRTNAPRLSTSGNSFHGMKKDFLIQNLEDISKNRKGIFFLDIDCAAAHSRIASFLLSDYESSLSTSLRDEGFWDGQISNVLPFYENYEVEIERKMVKKILKVGLYTSLNGGNPWSHDRLVDSLTLNAKDSVKEYTKGDFPLSETALYKATKEVLENFTLVNEVKNLSKNCIRKATIISHTP
jgi:hypothetical protein